MINVTVIGTVKRRQALTRSGARAGDDLYVSGTIGAAAAGLRILQERRALLTTEDTDATHANTCLVDGPSMSSCIQRYLRPEPRLRMGMLVARNRAAGACMDLSDGLADAVHQMAEASGVGMTIDAAALPIDPGAREFFAARGRDAVIEALSAGDDYELLLASRPRTRRRLDAAVRHDDVPLTRVGRCTEDRLVTLQRTAGSIDAIPLPQGYSHFR
jgi:thiamine-monophosphate kinase